MKRVIGAGNDRSLGARTNRWYPYATPLARVEFEAGTEQVGEQREPSLRGRTLEG
jgi:hypothetical protein